MRLKEEIKRTGYFWLSTIPDKKIPGVITVLDGGNIELEIIGLFDESIEGLNNALNGKYENIKRIHGHIEKHGLVTLEECIYTKKSISFGGISKSKLDVSKAFFGVEFNDDPIKINSFRFSIEGLDQWVGISGITAKYESKNKVQLQSVYFRYDPPKEICIELKDNISLFITFSWSIPMQGPVVTEGKISQKTFFRLVSKDVKPLEDFMSVAYKITNFIGLGIDMTVSIEDVTIYLSSFSRNIGEKDTQPIPIALFYPSYPCDELPPKIKTHKMLFNYDQIKDSAEQKLKKWMDAYEVVEPSLSLYFSTKSNSKDFLRSKFLSLVQGLETYHRRMSQEKVFEEKYFERLKDDLLAICPKESKEWLSNRLKHSNELSLAKRIKQIITPFQKWFGTKENRKKLIRKIVDTRNFLTHYDKSLESNAASGSELWKLCLKLEAIFQIQILSLLCFSEAEIEAIYKNNQGLKWKLTVDNIHENE